MASQEALSLTIQDEQTLLSAFMPLLERGGIFVPTREHYELGQEVYLLLTLPGESERVPVTGQVVWVSPDGVTGQRVPGIGIHFSTEDLGVRDRIEALLAGQLNEDTPTHTF
ncbi:pilus assembly protein PilZ [Halomonas sp. MCCC 1A11036]|uniref:Pilus assembly protein PilZ n=1 Tax=Billgrantia zhangzhouensis TaxID=2733481 RepID=A0ABS9AE85_9GAMM|nr:PilZ domain-containing protein [Halomonas zhangzhouensis]MCE8020053.1 pilus assembly protein PilZ [Halomonas zhangzhouensis]